MGIHFHANYLVLLQFAVPLHLLCKNKKKSHYLNYKTQVKNVVSHTQFERMFTYLTLALNLCVMCTSLSLLLIGTWSKHNDNSPSLQCLIFIFCLLSHWKIFTLLPYRSLSLLRGRTFSRGTSRLCNWCPGQSRNNGAVGHVFITATVKVLPKFFDVGGSE